MPNFIKNFQLTILFLLIFGLTACGQTNSKKKNSTEEKLTTTNQTIVATIGERKITADEVVKALAAQKDTTQIRFSTTERKKKFLEKLIRFEVLVAEAKKRGLEKDPIVQKQIKNVMVNALMKKLNNELVSFSDVKEEEVKAEFEKQKENFTRPAMVRAAVIVVANKKDAHAIAKELEKNKNNPKYFAQLAREKSINEASKKKMGDIGFFAENDEKIPQIIRKSVYEAKQMGQIIGPLKITKGEYKGFALAMRTGFRPAINRPYNLVRDKLKNKIYHEKRFKAIKAYGEKLRKDAKIVIDENMLAKIK